MITTDCNTKSSGNGKRHCRMLIRGHINKLGKAVFYGNCYFVTTQLFSEKLSQLRRKLLPFLLHFEVSHKFTPFKSKVAF